MKKHIKYIALVIFTIMAVLTVMPAQKAEAAPGDFLYKWGGNGTGDEQFRYPNGIEADSLGNVYVADMMNRRVKVFDSNGTFLRKWGSWGSGDGQFNVPYDIALDGTGNVYVVDFFNNRIQVFDSDGMFLRKWGSLGSGDGQFFQPKSIAVDGDGNVYVADSYNNRVQVFDSYGNFLFKWGSRGYEDGQFIGLQGIAVDGDGNVYVVGWITNRVQVFDSNGTFLRNWGSYGTGDGQIIDPWGIAVDGSGNVYVADGNHRIQVFDSYGNFLFKWGSYGTGDGQFNYVTDIAIGASGNFYVTSNHRIQVFEGFGELNSSPLADAGLDQAVECLDLSATPVTLDGSLSSDPDGDTLTYSWTGAFGSAIGVSPQVVMPYGAGTGTLTVEDTSGATDSDTINITVADTTAPATAAIIDGTLGDNDWYVSDVTVTLMATDNCTGVKEIHYQVNGEEVIVAGNSVTVSLVSDGTYTLSYFAVDNAETPEDAHNLTFKIDKTPPVITIEGVADGATYVFGLVPAAGSVVNDAGSTVVQVTEDLNGGDGLGLGIFTFSVTAVDEAGNTANEIATYEVIATQAGLTAYIEGLAASSVIPANTANNLLNMLNNADLGALVNRLEALIQHLQTPNQLEEGQILIEVAEILINAAQYMIDIP